MSRMNTTIPLGIEAPDFIGAMNRGALAGQQRNDIDQTNALRNFMAQSGGDVFAGDQNALRQYAQFNPEAAYDMQAAQADAARRDQLFQMEQQRFGMEQQRFAAENAPDPDAFMSEIVNGLGYYFSQGDTEGYYSALESAGIDPQDMPIEAFPMVAAQFGVQVEAPEAPAGPDPQSAIAKLQMDLNAGLITQEQYDMAAADLAPSNTTVYGPNGQVLYQTGNGGAQSGMSPYDPELMISNIDAILNDPKLPAATGMDAWRTYIPGPLGARGVGARMDQLQGQAFLQAFQSLKGSGQITEIEGTKATAAIARLDRYQSQEEYTAALTELRGILAAAAQRPPGWAETQQGGQPAPQTATTLPATPPQDMPDFSQMAAPEVLSFDVGNATPEAIAAWNRRMDELGL